jgi:hypothetical protein
LWLAEHDAACFFGHDFHVADLFQAFEDDLLGEIVGTDGLVSGITDSYYFGQMLLAEVSCKRVAGFACNRNEIL